MCSLGIAQQRRWVSSQRQQSLKYPVVLVHGFLGFTNIGPINYFKVKQCLEKELNLKVYQPQIPPTASVEQRAEALRQQLPKNEKVNIIAHSMAGLDSRWLLDPSSARGNQAAQNVSSLVTLGTPHRGSALADFFMSSFRIYPNHNSLDGLKRKYTSLTQKYRWDSDSEILGKRFGALACLTTQYAAKFNEEIIDNPSVDYISVGGYRKSDDMAPLLKTSCQYLEEREGDNDGLVSLASASWGSRNITVEADHMELVGWQLPFAETSFRRLVQEYLPKEAQRGLERLLSDMNPRNSNEAISQGQKQYNSFDAELFFGQLINELAERGH